MKCREKVHVRGVNPTTEIVSSKLVGYLIGDKLYDLWSNRIGGSVFIMWTNIVILL